MREEKIDKEEFKKIKKMVSEAFERMNEKLKEENKKSKEELKVKEDFAELLFDIMPKTNYNECFKAGFYVNKKHNKIMDAINILGKYDEMDDKIAKKFIELFDVVGELYEKAIEKLKLDEIIEIDDDDDEDDDDE